MPMIASDAFDREAWVQRWRSLALVPITLLLSSASPAQQPAAATLTAVRPDAALIDKGEIGIATYAMLFVIVALLVDRWLDRRAIGRLADAIDHRDAADNKRAMAFLVQISAMTAALGREAPKPEIEE